MNNKKIDIYTRRLLTGLANSGFIYECSTTWSKTCKEAKARFLSAHPYLQPQQVKACFSKK
jgi:hypothetical protein